MDAGTRAALAERTRAQVETRGALYVFAYASLIWRTPYPVTQSTPATVAGYRVEACMWTVQARGSPGAPGLGLGLVRGDGESTGVVQRVPDAAVDEALAALWEREMLTGVYLPRWLSARTGRGPVEALAFVVDPAHPLYAGRLPLARQARLIARAAGSLGTNLEYLEATVKGLVGAGVDCPALADLLARTRRQASPERAPRS